MPYLEAYGQIVVWGRGVYLDSRLLAHNHGEKMVGDKIYSDQAWEGGFLLANS